MINVDDDEIQNEKTYINEFLPDGLPERLYKFCSVNDNTYTALRNGYLWYSSPSSFNDPYDCYRHLLKFEPTAEDIIAFITKNYQLSEEGLKKKKNYYLQNPHLIPQAHYDTLADTIDAQGVCCFTVNHTNTLMWSHYAKHHSGICLVFEPRNDLNSFFVGKVRYKEEFQSFNYYNQSHIGLMYLLMTKSHDWSYESEYRGIHHSHGPVPFQKAALTEIIFGCKTSREDILSVINTIESSEYKVMKYSQAYMEPHTFRLAFKPIALI